MGHLISRPSDLKVPLPKPPHHWHSDLSGASQAPWAGQTGTSGAGTAWLSILPCFPWVLSICREGWVGLGSGPPHPHGALNRSQGSKMLPPPVTGQKGSDFPELGGDTLPPGLSTFPCVTFISHYGHAGWPSQVGVGWANLRDAGCLVPSQLPAGEALSPSLVTRHTTAEHPACSRLQSRCW